MNNADKPAMPSEVDLIELNHPDSPKYAGGIMSTYGLTKREQACITLGIPETGDEELDAIIVKSERKRIASLCLQAWIQHHGSNGGLGFNPPAAAGLAIERADALIEGLDDAT